MPTSYAAQIYRERAEECFLFAKTAHDSSTGSALERLGYEMLEAAEELEPTKAVTLYGATLRAIASTKVAQSSD
jgi:hypothetical protein